MASIVKVDSTSIEDGFRSAKVEQYGMKTADLVQPFGEDSNPIKNMVAIFEETDTDGNPIIIGYLSPNALAAVGERRMYSVDGSGSEKAFIWLKNDGNIELNGSGDNVVRFTPLERGLMQMVQKFNLELTKIQTAISGVGGAYAKVDVDVDVSGAKVDNVKCP